MGGTLHRRWSGARRGVVLGLVLIVGIILLLVGLAMISQSQGVLLGGVDSKQRIRSRLAAETQATLQVAAALEKIDLLYGTDMNLPGTALAVLPTGDGLKGSSTVEQTGTLSGQLTQELLTSGPFKGLLGLKLGYLVHAVGYASGGAKSKVDVEIKFYQVPLFQFGVFYNGNLEISPGSQMTIHGPVHTNGSVYIRSPGAYFWHTVFFQGPVTAAGNIYQWMGAGRITYKIAPDEADTFRPPLNTYMTAATSATVPAAVDGVRNVRWGVDSLQLPIDTSDAHQLLMPSNAGDPVALARQKFANRASSASRWINPGTGSGRPSWIKGNGANNAHRVFWDRREKAWVRYWNFDVAALIASGNKDSVFYIADTFDHGIDKGLAHKQTINAFRIVNASVLPRNMTIASPNPIYVLGDFNVGPTIGCGDRSSGSLPPGGDYCNAAIASDALTLLSPKWNNYKRGNSNACNERIGNLDQGSENALWTMDASSPEPTSGVPSDTNLVWSDSCGAYAGEITINAAILTGNRASSLSVLAPSNTNNAIYEMGYEGGWHNSVRFLEHLLYVKVNFNGSFACLWEAQSRGLKLTGKVQSTSYYSPPERNWGYDTRFRNLVNMPPATPFLASTPTTTWKETR
jgi:hypothetical protein